MSKRHQTLKTWITHTLSRQFHHPVQSFEIQKIAGDASFRSYYRVIYQGYSFVVMDAPPEHEDCVPFINIATQWSSAGVRVPKLIAQNLDEGFLLLEDFGDQVFALGLTPKTADVRYQKALEELQKIQLLPVNQLPVYSSDLLMREMGLFREWFLSSWLQLELTDQEEKMLSQVELKLTQSAQQQPQVVVHRDFHSRNLMLLADGDIGVIDFQDAVIGAVTYDLVSLLRDSYVNWSEDLVIEWLTGFYESSSMCRQLSWLDFMRAFDWMGMQRQLKVCGIFVRLCQRDGKKAYLQDIPLTFRNLMQSASRYDEFKAFADWLSQRILPELTARPELSSLPSDYWECR